MQVILDIKLPSPAAAATGMCGINCYRQDCCRNPLLYSIQQTMSVPAEVVSELTKVTKALLPLQAGRCKLVCDAYSSNVISTSTSRELLS
jgi:hypothetical protein